MVREHSHTDGSSSSSIHKNHGPTSSRPKTHEGKTTTHHHTSEVPHHSTTAKPHHTSKNPKPTHHVSIADTGQHTIAPGAIPVSLLTSTLTHHPTHKVHETHTHPLPSVPMKNTISESTFSTATSITTTTSNPTQTATGSADSAGISSQQFNHIATMIIAVLVVFTLLLLVVGGCGIWMCLRSSRRRRKQVPWYKFWKCCSSHKATEQPSQERGLGSGARWSPERRDFIMPPQKPVPSVPYETTRPATQPWRQEFNDNNVVAGNVTQPQVARSDSIIRAGLHQPTPLRAADNPYNLPPLPSTYGNNTAL